MAPNVQAVTTYTLPIVQAVISVQRFSRYNLHPAQRLSRYSLRPAVSTVTSDHCFSRYDLPRVFRPLLQPNVSAVPTYNSYFDSLSSEYRRPCATLQP